MAISESDALVLFGVTGDLAHKMIFPALYAMVKKGALKAPVIGFAFSSVSTPQLRPKEADALFEAIGGRHNPGIESKSRK